MPATGATILPREVTRVQTPAATLGGRRYAKEEW